MGLSGPRTRRKLDFDPNNTRWTRDETTFGQKILRAHGWEPGKYLGSQEAGHAQLHSAASLAPIKINLKDDTLGLGAKIIQKASDECTGLDVFKDLLGRLNGKSEETLAKERQVRSEIKTNLVIERRYGPMRFVSGGLLVGDQMMAQLVKKEESEDKPIKEESSPEPTEPEPPKKEKKEKKSKKRKAAESEDADPSESKPEKKRKKRSKDDGPEEEDADVKASTKKEKKKEKKDKKSKRAEKAAEEEDAVASVPEVKRKKSKKSKDKSQSDSSSEDPTEPSEDASEKARKKEKKEKKKDKKRREADGTESTVTASKKISTSITVSASAGQDSGSSTPQSTGVSTPRPISGRHLARSRNIASKKMAFGDMQALNQIFMIKPV